MRKQELNQPVKRVVIALPGSKRLPGFLDSPTSMGFEVFDAVDGRASNPLPIIDYEGFKTNFEREILPGEAGCSVSHYRVLQEFAEDEGSDDDWILVAEDDARPVADLDRYMERILAANKRRFNYIILATPWDGVGYRRLKSLGAREAQPSLLASWVGELPWPWRFRFGSFHGDAYGAGLYLTTREIARRYVAAADTHRIAWPADAYQCWPPEVGLHIGLTVPNLASWEGSTTIGERGYFSAKGDPAPKRTGLSLWVQQFRSTLAVRTRAHYLLRRLLATAKDVRYLLRGRD